MEVSSNQASRGKAAAAMTASTRPWGRWDSGEACRVAVDVRRWAGGFRSTADSTASCIALRQPTDPAAARPQPYLQLHSSGTGGGAGAALHRRAAAVRQQQRAGGCLEGWRPVVVVGGGPWLAFNQHPQQAVGQGRGGGGTVGQGRPNLQVLAAGWAGAVRAGKCIRQLQAAAADSSSSSSSAERCQTTSLPAALEQHICPCQPQRTGCRQ